MSDYLHADGFGNLSDGTHTVGVDREILGDQWTSFAQNFKIEDIADGRKWITTPSTSAVEFQLQTGSWTTQTTIRHGFRFKPTGAYAGPVYCYYDGAGILGFLNFNGSQLVYHASNSPFSGTVLTSTALPIGSETWVEVEVYFHSSAGTVKFWFNGSLVANISGVNTIWAFGLGTSCDNMQLGPNMTGASGFPREAKLTDHIVYTVTAPLGDTGIYYIAVDADGVVTDFTPSSGGDNYADVDEIGPDEDTTYNESAGGSGDKDSLGTPGKAAVSVLSVGASVRSRKTGAGAASHLVGIYHGGSETQSAAKGLGTSYLTLVEFVDDCPSTGNPWSVAEVAAAEVSYEVD